MTKCVIYGVNIYRQVRGNGKHMATLTATHCSLLYTFGRQNEKTFPAVSFMGTLESCNIVATL